MHTKQVITVGGPLSPGKKVLIVLHGRGGSAEDILGLTNYLETKDFVKIAPKATNNTWYPYSFLEVPENNEPWLSAALNVVKSVVDDVKNAGIPVGDIYFGGFSQGACLAMEFITRNADNYGGAFAFTGGLIGDKIYEKNYSGDFKGMPVFIGSSNPDSHVPVERIHSTEKILKERNANVTVKIYPNMGHTIIEDEIQQVNQLILNK